MSLLRHTGTRRFLALVVLLAIIVGLMRTAAGAIVANTTASKTGSSVSSLTWSHTVASGSNRILLVRVAHLDTTVSISTVKYGGVALTLLDSATSGNGSAASQVDLYYLLAPTVGTASVVVSLSGSANVVAFSEDFSGVSQTTPFGTVVEASNSTTTPSTTITGSTTDLFVDVVGTRGSGGSTATPGSGQTGTYAATGSTSSDILGMFSTKPGAASTTLTWSYTTGTPPWISIGVPLKAAGATVSGTVFEDVNYGGGAGRSLATSSGAGVVGATVELYDSTGTYVGSTTTATGGSYSFTNVAAGTWYVRVASGTVASNRSGSTAALRGVMTYRTDASSGSAVAVTNYVGGTNPALVDPGAGSSGAAFNTATGVFSAVLSGTAQAFAPVAVGSSNITGVDFGFNFDTVVNTSDTGQGSLRQAMTNANALGTDSGLAQSGRTAGLENLVFMISNGSTAAGLRSAYNYFATSAGSYNVATITLASALPTVSAPLVIDAQTQPGWSLAPLIEINCNNVNMTAFKLSAGNSALRGFVVNRVNTSGSALQIDTAGGNTVQGNYFGLDAAGATGSVNGGQQVQVYSGTNQIGGNTPAQRNVIGEAYSNGIVVWSGNANVIQGNYLGTNAAGTAALGSSDSGVVLPPSSTATNTLIGGTAPGQGNLISGNTGNQATTGGIAIQGSSSTGTLIQGNSLGLNAAGTGTIASGGYGIYVAAASTTVGGTATGAGNTITAYGGKGVAVVGSTTNGVAIEGNAIYGNTGIGIDLANDGVTANTGSKTSSQPNLLMNTPVFTSASISGILLKVTGYVGSAANQSTFAGSRVEVFISDATSANGQGKTYLGALTTDANGNFSGTISGASGITVGTSKLSGTATDTSNNTSEFGPNYLVSNLSLGGTVFEDVNYGGGSGRSLAASGGSGAAGAVVELYNASGSYIASTTTATGGTYSFTGLAASNSYFVRVAGPSVASTRSGSTASLVGVLTYRTDASAGSASAVTNYVGGTNPALVDPGAASSGAAFSTSTFVFSAGLTGTAQAVTPVALGSASIAGLDFGFNFDTVVNTNDSGAGSLRQAIINANALTNDSALVQASGTGVGTARTAGVENLVFMVSNGSTAAGLRSANNYFSGGVATITPTSALPTLSTAMVIDAQTQPGWTASPVIDVNGSGAGAVNGFNLSGGSTTLRGLVIRNFSGANGGVYISGGAGDTIQGCWIGLSPAGTAAAANTYGIYVSSNGNTMGGATASARNVVSGNANSGVVIWIGSDSNTVQGNYIGLNALGTATVGNTQDGIVIFGTNTVVGGANAGQGNVISGNDTGAVSTEGGVQTVGSGTALIRGNLFGLTADGSATLASNGWAVLIGTAGSTVGGTVAGAGNTITAHALGGVAVTGSGTTGVAIEGNAIYGNGSIGIDLAADGATANHSTKTSSQPNLLMDYPVFTTASLSGSTLSVSGYVGSAASQSTFASARVEVFASDATNANGQGKTYLGYLTTDANGNFSGTLNGVSGLTPGTSAITGTATDTSGNTSEFGPNLTAGYAITGTVYEDVNYSGGSGRDRAASLANGGAGVANTTVELYSAAGSYVGSTTTAADGSYSFSSLAASAYLVRVVQGTVRSTRPGSAAGLLPVQTYRYEASWNGAAAVTNEVGGEQPSVADSGAQVTMAWTQCATESGGSSNPCSFSGTHVVRFGTGTNWTLRIATDGIACAVTTFGDPAPGSAKTCQVLTPNLHSASSASTMAGSATGVDFGFNFDTVTNTNDSGQGSLRQAITNANALGGDASLAQGGRTAGIENLVFMIPNGTTTGGGSLGLSGGQRSSYNYFTTAAGSYNVATIAPASALPTLSTAMVIDAQTQPGWSANPVIELNGTSAGNSHGLQTSAAGSIVRGLVINRFYMTGIYFNSTGNTVQGCWLGLNAAGTAASGNGAAGIYLTAGSNTIGGTATTQRNVVSGNGSGQGTYNAGILVSSGSGNVIQGNYVGLNASGTAAVANLPYGLDITGTTTTIGGTATGAGNVISGNSLDGVILRPNANGATIQGNTIGAKADNSAVVANGRIGIDLQANNATVGGTATGAANIVRGNTNGGVVVVGNATGNNITANSVYGNGGIGIDLGYTQAILANDGAKTAGVPNQYMDFPVFTSVSLSGTTLSVAGYVGSAANQSTFASSRVEVFISDATDPNGQGKTYLGYVTTDANGNFYGTITGVSGVANGGTSVTGTATDSANNTSEFGPNALVGLGITGTVFEDANYGGGAGRSLAGSGGGGASGATVELYNASGAYLASTTTTTGGGYSFVGNGPGTYYVRVVNNTVVSQRSGSVNTLVGVMTYRSDASSGAAVDVTNLVGGTNPALADPGTASSGAALTPATGVFSAGLSGTAQALAPVALAATSVAGVNFGFNFDTVVNTNDTGQGSLRQAITNANALGGDASLAQSGRTAGIENLVFMISNGSSAAGLRSGFNYFSGGVATLAPASALPTVTSPLVLDAQTQPGWTLSPLIELNGSGAGSSANGLNVNADGSVVRGWIIDRFGGQGLQSSTGAGLVIQGNYIGTTSSGNAAAGNGQQGIFLSGNGNGHLVGGTTAAQRNVVAGNGSRGITIAGGSGHLVQGNRVGVGADGVTLIPNSGFGVLMQANSSNSTVGGTAAAAANLIRGNSRGVQVDAGAYGIAVLGNAIYGNNGLGINLGAPGPNRNDGAKTAGQANLLMDTPVFTSASFSGTTLALAGYVGSAPGQSVFANARVEVFISDNTASGYGEGQTWLGYLTTDANGNFSGTITGVSGVTVGSTRITGTATDTSGDTSEFGPDFTVANLTVAGTVFEDVNYGGGAGRSLSVSGGPGLAGATVELYDSGGNFVASTTTAADGTYSFRGLSSGAYWVRVVGASVLSQRSGSTAALAGVMTWRADASSGTAVAVANAVGGTNPALVDPGAASTGAAFNTATFAYSAGLSGTAQSVTPVSLAGGAVTGIDFGFNFDTVVNTNDSGTGSLRQAITNANTLGGDAGLAQGGRTAGIENIVFMIANGSSAAGLRSTLNYFTTSGGSSNLATIAPLSALPSLASPLVLDAQTQPGFGATPLIELNGSSAGAATGLAPGASGVVVRGFVINRFGGAGIAITGGNGVVVQGCWIGLNAAGSAASANNGPGISTSGNGNALQIGGTGSTQGNVVSGNATWGIYVGGGSGHLLQGNLVGTNAAGTAAVGNGGRGIFLDSGVGTATLGGTANGAGNVISGNNDYALWLAGGATVVQGNLIGLNAAGTAALGNVSGVWAATGGHQFGGTTVAARNVISGNGNRGLWLNSAGNTVQGNYIGTNAAGSAALPNGDGVYSKGASNTIGGSVAGAGNLISGNTGNGVLLNAVASGSVVQGNVIGLNAAGNAALPNAVGVNVSCSSGCAIGGTASGAGNVVSGNSGVGVVVNSGSAGNAILGNSIYGNGGLGIDLGNDGVSPNDGAKTAGAANLLMDTPVLTSARARGNALAMAGYVGSATGQSLFAGSRVEFFISDGNASGHGAGKTYLGALTTDGNGNFSGSVSMPVAALAIGSKLTATATDGAGNTSEFGPNFSALLVDLVVNSNLDEADLSPGDGYCLTASGVCTLRAAIAELNAQAMLPATPTIVFSIPGCSSYGSTGCRITPATALPSVTMPMVIDATTQPGWNAGTFAAMIQVDGAAAPGGTTGLTLAASSSTLRGLSVTGFSGIGVTVSGSANLLAGDTIGLTPLGAMAANGAAGIVLLGSGNAVGSASAADRNLIAGNAGSGVLVAANGASVVGNAIGTDASGSGGLGNGGNGVSVQSWVTGATISGNTIVNNAVSGVGVATAAQQVQVSGNAISGNTILGIDLGNNGITANTGTTSTSLANDGMNEPIITGAGLNGGGTSLTLYGYIGTATSQAAFAGARVEFFKAVPDASNAGQGQVYLGTLTADASGRFSGTISVAASQLSVGDPLTATATDPSGDTSEFGPNWITTTVSALSPAGFNAFETATSAGALTGAIQSHVAGSPTTLDVIALDNTGTSLNPGFTGRVSLSWLDARDDSGSTSGSCRSSWINLGSAGSAVFASNSRVTVGLTPPSSGTRSMRLMMSYTGASGSVTVACSGDAFAALPAQLAWINASDADSATPGTLRVLSNANASGGVVHRAGQAFTVRAQALDATGALMTGYDGSPALAASGCVLPAGCTAAALGGTTGSAIAGVYSNATVTYADVGAVLLRLVDTTYGAVDSADTPLSARTISSGDLTVGRFVPDNFTTAISTAPLLATANGACMASGQGSTFLGQGFGWTTAPQVIVTARNAAGATTTMWTGALMKLAPGTGSAETLSVSGAGSATLSASYGALTMQDLGGGHASVGASSLDRFVLDVTAGAVQASSVPAWAWGLVVVDSSEAFVSGNPSTTATAAQAGVGFDQGALFHSGRLMLAPAHGDARSGVRLAVQLQRWSSAGWVTMTEDRGCISVQPSNLGVESPSGVFSSLGVCTAPMQAGVTTAGGRAWLALPGTPGAASGRLTLRLAGAASSGVSCTASGATNALSAMVPYWLLGGSNGTGSAALATWGKAGDDTVLRREVW